MPPVQKLHREQGSYRSCYEGIPLILFVSDVAEEAIAPFQANRETEEKQRNL